VASVARERRYLMALDAFSPEATRDFVRNNLAVRNPHLVAVQEGRVVGWCDICRLSPEGFHHTGRLGMGVRREWRGQGLGRRLLATALVTAGGAGFRRIELEVFASNTPARHLYASLGFVVEGVKHQARILDGVTDDVVLMALPLQA
jgi:ribosomal protein S18 acetylase RimI-like enzyme